MKDNEGKTDGRSAPSLKERGKKGTNDAGIAPSQTRKVRKARTIGRSLLLSTRKARAMVWSLLPAAGKARKSKKDHAVRSFPQHEGQGVALRVWAFDNSLLPFSLLGRFFPLGATALRLPPPLYPSAITLSSARLRRRRNDRCGCCLVCAGGGHDIRTRRTRSGAESTPGVMDIVLLASLWFGFGLS